MAININNLNNQSQVKQKVEQQQKVQQQANQNASNATQAKHVAKDSVSLTPQAQKMADLQKKAKADDAPAIDQQKIQQIKKAIASGEYKIDPDKLAENIAGFEFKLG